MLVRISDVTKKLMVEFPEYLVSGQGSVARFNFLNNGLGAVSGQVRYGTGRFINLITNT